MAVRDQLIEATADLMRRHGVAGTGVAEILKESGVARRSLYLNFPGGKTELVTATTKTAGGALTAVLSAVMTKPDPIGAFAEMWSAMLRATDFQGGCPVVAAALGRHSAAGATEAAVEVFGEWRRVIADHLHEAGVADTVAASLATTIVAAVEGAVVLSEATRTTAPLDDVAAHLNELVALHLAG
ncbi:TetR/AcrR family transcriptional regulator [Gordonia soli]|uniref:Putative TetR family transcriptional regulator n=1 Tax=Gordonia soli NBRC 108243 TaxID=1223545 RepID=M0QIU0_9ACTN|nr:TetR/AcrR family transcriptional regulator [Gordonia soli]GAC68545.1 putative TetR family transcriptional regulator [Gordonia soli NBRC 108243]